MMSWKRNVFSNAIWLVYLLLAGAVLFGPAQMLKEFLNCGLYMEVLAVAVALVVSGGIVVLLHFLVCRNQKAKEKRTRTYVYILPEAVFAVLFLVLGLVLRVIRLPEASEQVMYYETAKVMEGQSIPHIVHGASYVYLILLRVFLIFLGNKFIVGVWVQIVMQLLAALLLFFGVRKLTGPLAALIMLLFVTCSDLAVQESLILSPRIFFLFSFALGFGLVSVCKTKELYPKLFLLCGIVVGIICWLDAGGILLILIGLGVVFSEWEQEPGGLRRAGTVVLFLVGCLLGFLGVLSADTIYSYSRFESVAGAWFKLYQPQAPSFFWIIDGGITPWEILLITFLLFGIFSFWWDKRHERMGLWVTAAGVAAVAECFGLLTEELPAKMYLFLFLTILAGVAVQECFRKETERVMADESSQLEETKDQQEYTEYRVSQKDQKEKKNRFIENPLPLPKPHKRKTLDFDINPDDREADYDYFVDENDDYDIK